MDPALQLQFCSNTLEVKGSIITGTLYTNKYIKATGSLASNSNFCKYRHQFKLVILFIASMVVNLKMSGQINQLKSSGMLVSEPSMYAMCFVCKGVNYF